MSLQLIKQYGQAIPEGFENSRSMSGCPKQICIAVSETTKFKQAI